MLGTLNLLRIFFIFLSLVCGYYLGNVFLPGMRNGAEIGAGVGIIFALGLILLEIKLRRVSLRNLSAGVFGLLFGVLLAWVLTLVLKLVDMDESIYSTFQIVFTLVFCYLGMMISLKGKDEFNVIIPYVRFSREDRKDQLFLLDTSVIIDGRIAGICETGFIEGKLVVPRFILNELQQIADSSDDAKRIRGRRGLDMLNMLKKVEGVEVIIHDETFPGIKEVDAKLVRLAKILDSKVLTNDFNLNKVAKVEGVSILNINDLSNALKMVLFPGEEIKIYIRKEGKERNQGVAFMDDGTMIVVDNAKRLIGKNINVTVSSVLQTSAGRMVFANLIDRENRNGVEKPQRQETRGQKQEMRAQRLDEPGAKQDENAAPERESSSIPESKGPEM